MGIIIANIIDLLAACVQIWSGTLRKKQSILIAQIVQLLMQTVSMVILGGITGAVSNIIGCIRNYICYKEKLNVLWKTILIVAQLILTVLFNTQGLFGWLPFIVCTAYVLFMDIKNPIHFKILVTLSYVPWIYYFIVLKSYTGAVFATGTVITNTITLFKMRKKASYE